MKKGGPNTGLLFYITQRALSERRQKLAVYPAKAAITHHQDLVSFSGLGHYSRNQSIQILEAHSPIAQRH